MSNAISSINARVELSHGAQNGLVFSVSVGGGKPTLLHMAELPGRLRSVSARVADVVNTQVAPRLVGIAVNRQADIDMWLLDAWRQVGDATIPQEVVAGISLCVARAAAEAQGVSVFEYLRPYFGASSGEFKLPTPIVTYFEGDPVPAFSRSALRFQVLPSTSMNVTQALACARAVFATTSSLAKLQGSEFFYTASGAWRPPPSPGVKSMFETIKQNIVQSGFTPGKDVFLAATFLPSEFYHDGRYYLGERQNPLKKDEYWDFLKDLLQDQSILYIADIALAEHEDLYQELTAEYGSRMYIGSSMFGFPSPDVVPRFFDHEKPKANTLVASSQAFYTITSLKELLASVKNIEATSVLRTYEFGASPAVLADLAAAAGFDFVDFGPLQHSDSLSHFNRLVEIESELTHK